MSYQHIVSAELPTRFGTFLIHGFQDGQDKKEHIALTYGSFEQDDAPLIRIHSECLTGDALFSLRCDCGPQLESAMERICQEGKGVIIYLRQEGRGIGLLNKLRAYELQDQGADTVEANEQLGFQADLRQYTICGFILHHLGISRVKLLTNNPKKVAALTELGITVTERIPHKVGKNPHNASYLTTKQGKLGHLFDDEGVAD